MATIERQPVRTQFIVFTLFGDYLKAGGQAIWTSDLVYLLSLLGVTERAARSVLSRMKRKGWLSVVKKGRRSQYALTDKGNNLLERGSTRIFEPVSRNWNEKWQMVVYSLPEKLRKKRHSLRTQLNWLGFGSLSPGTWISPHDRTAELTEFFSFLDVEEQVDIFSGVYLGPDSVKSLVARCWDLNELELQYREFISRNQLELSGFENNKNGSLSPEAYFVSRFWLTHEFQTFTLKDPNLPSALLPDDWVGYEARELFTRFYQFLGSEANRYVDSVINHPNGKA